MKNYADFDIQIETASATPAGVQTYVLRVDSPAGRATGKLDLDIATQEFVTQLRLAGSDGPDLETRRALGQALFEALFKGDVRDLWTASRTRVDANQADGLRLRLQIDAPELAALPWELLYETKRDSFLATEARFSLTRYLAVPEPPQFAAQPKLRILVVVQSPEGLAPIDPKEVSNLGAALGSLGAAIDFHILPTNASRATIQEELQQVEYHVFHFLGHGDASQIVLTDDDGKQPLMISDQEFAQLFLGRRLRLVVLNACFSSNPTGGQGGIFVGIGPALVRKQVPAVVAMQYHTVYLDTASKFSQALYRALANGLPVDAAVNEARQLLSFGELLQARDWSTPVLYLGTKSEHVFELAGQAASGDEDRPVPGAPAPEPAPQPVDATATPPPTYVSQFVNREREQRGFHLMLEGKATRSIMLVEAPEKMGKTWLILNLGYLCRRQRIPVFQFNFADGVPWDYLTILSEARRHLGDVSSFQELEDAVRTSRPPSDEVARRFNEERLSDAFFHCIRQVAGQRLVVFLFDTLEKAPAEARAWLQRQLMLPIRDGKLTSVVVVVAGRSTLELDEDWTHAIARTDLAAFESKHIEDYFKKRGRAALIAGAGVVDELMNAGCNHPKQLAQKFIEMSAAEDKAQDKQEDDSWILS